ncbi:hypothetical protein [Bradyrhizobium archetypum]|uniref:Uncharacterized protein n=1 Tax=Bradyrhizobium archetypum TaxID=2721160 RepID=A0A7Y4M4U4_9BRAD|nr:hypothetical protein [Bradyrhizobium archetypum]NOJ50203.1 hypothetical protein [Bradyrhizobium archetypum]
MGHIETGSACPQLTDNNAATIVSKTVASAIDTSPVFASSKATILHHC